MQKSMLEVAYEIVEKSKKPLTFKSLWEKVAKTLKFDEKQIEDNIARFYSQLSVDNRFVMLEENHWDLKERHPYEKGHIDMNEIYLDADEDDDEAEEKDGEEGESDDDDEYNDKFEEEDEDVPFGFQSMDDEDDDF